MRAWARRRWGRPGFFALAGFVVLAHAGGAWADTKRLSDANDTSGPLDIRAATHAHAGRRVVHTLVTFGNWSAGTLGPRTPNFLALELDTKGDRRPERIVLIVSNEGRFVAGVFTRSGSYVGSAGASRPNAHTIRVTLRRSRLGTSPGYRWAALSYFKGANCPHGCTDLVPNHGLVLHDLTAPRAFFFGSLWNVVPAPEYDLAFTVSDSGGSQLDSWRLERRSYGDTAWELAASGGTVGSKTHHQTSTQGDTDQFRIVAVDRQGNRTATPVRTISVPVDDSNAALVYTTGWSTSVLNSAFLGTLHTADDDSLPASVTYLFTGSFVGIVSPTGNSWIDTQGSVFIDGVHVGDYFPGDLTEGSRQIVFTHGGLDPGTAHTLRIDAASQFVPLDGIIVR